MSTVAMNRVVYEDCFDLPAAPEQVFPLLCPVREHDWIPGWRAEIVYSRSGFAELDCVFTTDQPNEGRRTWICTRYEPHRAIGYTAFSSTGYLMRLEVGLEAAEGGGTRVSWTRRFIAISPEGNAWVGRLPPPGASPATRTLARLLAHYLATGTMLTAG
jgi:hypothetical protein